MSDLRTIGEMTVAVFESNAALGQAAADFAAVIKQEVNSRDEVAVIFATGKSTETRYVASSEHVTPGLP